MKLLKVTPFLFIIIFVGNLKIADCRIIYSHLSSGSGNIYGKECKRTDPYNKNRTR